MSIMGAKVQCVPAARLSIAATRVSISISSRSKVPDEAMGIGKMVRYPWMMSLPMMSGMPCSLSSKAARWMWLVYLAPLEPYMQPTAPLRASARHSSTTPSR